VAIASSLSPFECLQYDIELQSHGEGNKTEDSGENSSDSGVSDTSSLSFEPLSSSEDSDTDVSNEVMASLETKRKSNLRNHIGETIDRLHGIARQIQWAGAQHRRERVDRYRNKPGPQEMFLMFKGLALQKAQNHFKLATNTMQDRIAESFARRRIRFEYLKEHQKKVTMAMSLPHQPEPTSSRAPQFTDESGQVSTSEPPLKPNDNANAPVQTPGHDDGTLYSATQNTKFAKVPETQLEEPAESVRSVVIRHSGFPPPPDVSKTDSFECPYCRLEFPAREAKMGRWRYIVYTCQL